MADITAIELRELADLIDSFSDLQNKSERAGLLTDEAFLSEYKKLEKKIQTQLTNTIKGKTK